ncbi:MAG: hypothetical protein K1Y36_00285 [Blastocatellia bacterium]|nr:hypothetical protein [Blastocatellia bacterium]
MTASPAQTAALSMVPCRLSIEKALSRFPNSGCFFLVETVDSAGNRNFFPNRELTKP